jgi:hypothetical protein
MVDFSENFDYTYGMPRRPKDPKLRMETDLRIPVTTEQKQLILDATNDEPNGMSAWARAVLLEAAKKKLEEKKK